MDCLHKFFCLVRDWRHMPFASLTAPVNEIVLVTCFSCRKRTFRGQVPAQVNVLLIGRWVWPLAKLQEEFAVCTMKPQRRVNFIIAWSGLKWHSGSKGWTLVATKSKQMYQPLQIQHFPLELWWNQYHSTTCIADKILQACRQRCYILLLQYWDFSYLSHTTAVGWTTFHCFAKMPSRVEAVAVVRWMKHFWSVM